MSLLLSYCPEKRLQCCFCNSVPVIGFLTEAPWEDHIHSQDGSLQVNVVIMQCFHNNRQNSGEDFLCSLHAVVALVRYQLCFQKGYHPCFTKRRLDTKEILNDTIYCIMDYLSRIYHSIMFHSWKLIRYELFSNGKK